MDNIMRYNIDLLIKKSFDYWYYLKDVYNVTGKGNGITIFPSYDKNIPEEIVSILDNSRMVTVCQSLGNNDPKIPPEKRIVEDVDAHVYMTYQSLYQLIIECRLDFDEIYESMKFTLRHEMGHILDHRQYIGRTCKEWNDKCDKNKILQKQVPHLRRNASYKKRLEWYLMYNQNPVEKVANDFVGITEEDIIADYKRTHYK